MAMTDLEIFGRWMVMGSIPPDAPVARRFLTRNGVCDLCDTVGRVGEWADRDVWLCRVCLGDVTGGYVIDLPSKSKSVISSIGLRVIK